ncbi:hypothetical protein IW146_003859 [Coemansia sp. RSA 922]|nr:hypothetical protein H4S04_004555 [Coemansia sp. S16]KAJ2070289.1 hypothetical protein GGH13_004127 [Coemansia sp. S155-1]KAJ2113447.1 hypothetical protein IW146_003859 [Coemansia sp. RSA 922]
MTLEKQSDCTVHKTTIESSDIEAQPTEDTVSSDLDPRSGFPAYTRYAVIVGCFVLQGLSCGVVNSWGVQRQYLAANVYAGETSKIRMLSYTGTLMFFSLYLWGMLAGWLAEVWSYRKLCFVGVLAMALGQLLASFCEEPWQLCLTEGALFGLGVGLVFGPSSAAPARWFKKRRGLATGLAVTGAGAGGLVIAPLTEFLVHRVGVEWSLRVSATYIMVLGSIACYYTRVPFQDKTRSFSNFDWRAFGDLRFATNAGMVFLVVAGYIIPYAFLPEFWVAKGISSQTASVLIAVSNGASLLGRIITGFTADHFGVLNSLILGLGVTSLSCLLLWPFATNVCMGVVMSIFYGFGTGGYWALAPLVAAKLFGVDRLASISGVILTVSAAGSWAGSPVANAMLERPGHGSDFIAVSTYAGSLWLAAFVLALVNRTLYSKKIFSKV